ASPPQKKSADPLRLIVVDDDPDLVAMLKIALAEEFEFLSARDGLQAMELTARYKPDVFIIDWLMPKMSGYQFCQTLKRTDEFAFSPVIFISAKSTRKDRELIDRLGVYQFLAKPFKADDVERILQGITQRPDFQPRTDRPPYSEYLAEIELKEGNHDAGGSRVEWMD
ncbi:MAG: response regulator, partial [bacterium]